MLKKCQVVMLSTNEKAIMYNLFVRNKLFWTIEDNNLTTKGRLWDYANLYILSDDEIKKGNWYHNTLISSGVTYYNGQYPFLVDGDMKVIATTDNLLNLPNISQSFIKKYIEKYNKGNQIKEVNVVYSSNSEEYGADAAYFDEEVEEYPKVKDNKVSIKKIKTHFTLDDMIKAYSWGYGDRDAKLNPFAGIKPKDYFNEF